MEWYGYGGSILYVDLSQGKTWVEPLDSELLKKYIGCWGITHKLAYDLIPPDADPFSPENAIIFGTGPFTGTIAIGTGQTHVTYKCPLTGGFVTNGGGGNFSIMLKSSGYDFVVIKGQSPKPVYLRIRDDEVDLVDASDLWGKTDAWDTCDELRKKCEPCSVIPVGPAGENLIKYSLSFVDKGGGSMGNGGLPSVMGSKKLKAVVACQGTRGIKVADPVKLQKFADEMLTRVMQYRFRDKLIKEGTYGMTRGFMHIGKTSKNWTEVESGAYGPPFKETLELHKASRKNVACPSCPMGDKDRIKITKGDYAPMTGYMTDFLFHPSFGGKDVEQNYNLGVYWIDLLDRLGICEFNFNNTFQLMVKLYEEDIITKEDTGGIELKEDFETELKVLNMTAKREGFGDLMAEGALIASRKIGKGAEAYVNHIKGGVPFIDPRMDTLGTMCFSQLVTPGRTFYVPGGVGIYAPGRSVEDHMRHMPRMGIPPEVVPKLFTDSDYSVGRLDKWAEDWYSIFNTLGQCHRLYVHRFQSMDSFCELLAIITGMEFSGRELLKVGERNWNLQKVLNARAGQTRKDDEPPEVWFTPLKGKDGKEYPLMDYFRTKNLTREDVDKYLDEYYDERGWDIKTGLPTPEKLDELGLPGFDS